MGYYEFKESDAYDFARHVGIKAKPRGDELFFTTCPYCKPRPTKDNVRSFSINLKTGQFKCLRASCGVSGNMVTLSKDFDFSLGSDVDDYYRPKKQYRKLKAPEKAIEPKPQAIQYLKGRGISEDVIRKFQITVQNDHPNVLVFPFYDENSKLQFVKYRKTDYNKEKDSSKEWCEPNCKPILFGMMQCNDKFDRLILHEGQVDSISTSTAGIENAVSVPTGAKGFTWLPFCWNWMNKFKEIIVFGDHENGHITLLDEISHRLKITVKHVREEDYRDCKDANEILQKYGAEQVRRCVENAVVIPLKEVIDLSDVEDVDVAKLEKLSTGINQLDRLLYGGLPFGGIHLISGKPGEGKSTLASQILVNAIEQNYKCFAYSGELPNYLFKGWIDFQIAGQKHIFTYQNKWGDNNYSVSKTNREMIGNWYRDKVFLYDNRYVKGEERKSLISTVEDMIMQYGVRVILLDNLMTALTSDLVEGSNEYEKQTNFVNELRDIAMRHDVIILLVVHKRKNNFTTNENDEISGSGNIPNMALVTIAYEKNKELPDTQRLLKVSKNRIFGKTFTSGWTVDYDEKSKRIYGDGDDVNREYGWNISDDGFSKVEDSENPFQ